MKVGIYVGSFNPVHKDHMRIAKYALDNYLDRMIIIPTGAYWNKTKLENIDDRIAMLKLYENERIIIDNDHNNIPYTYQIFRELRKKYDDLYLIMGADSIVKFDNWKNYKGLLNYGLIIFGRDNIDVVSYLNKLGKIDNYIVVDGVVCDGISSTIARKYLKEGNDLINNVLDEKVINYIKKHRLYK